MLSYSMKRILPKIKGKLLYDIVSDTSSYKDFLPFCIDSFSTNKDSRELYSILNQNYSQLINNSNHTIKINNNGHCHELPIDINNLKEVVLKMGFDYFKFSYDSIVLRKEHDYILSVTKNNKVFNNLTSLLLFEEKSNDEILIKYSVDFEFKSKIYSTLANLVLDSLGESMVEAYLAKADKEFLMINNEKDLENYHFLTKCHIKGIFNKNEIKLIKSRLLNEPYMIKLSFYRKDCIFESNAYINIMRNDLLE